MFVHNIDPVLLHIGPISIRYYGLVYAFGFLLVHYILIKSIKRHPIKNLPEDKASDMLAWGMVWLVVGARIFHVLTDLPLYLSNPMLIFAIWKGGMAFFGGSIGLTAYLYYFTRKNKIDLFEIAERIIVPIPLILGFGRIANFINAEHIGYITSVPWAVKFPGAEGFRHPTQIYEAITMFALFFILFLVPKKNTKRGTLVYLFLSIYGISRFFTEFFRINMVHLGFLTDAQWMSLLFIILGSYGLISTRKSRYIKK